MEELDKILNGEPEEEAQKKSLEADATAKAEEEKKQEDLDVQKKKEQLENLNKAIREANEQLKTARTAKKQEISEDTIPKIDKDDPASKAWLKEIKENVNPLQQEIEKEKGEIFDMSLRKFLNDNPYIAGKPEKLKELVEVYQRNDTSTGRIPELVYKNLEKSAAFLFHDELISQVRDSRMRKVQGDALFSAPAVSRGSNAYSRERELSPADSLSDEDRNIIQNVWGISVEEWAEDKKKYA